MKTAEEILKIFINLKSSKVGEFGNIYPQILSDLSKKKDKVVILEIGNRRGETFKTLLDIADNFIVYGIDIGVGEYKKLKTN